MGIDMNRPIQFRSTDEEMFMLGWAQEAKDAGIIESIVYEPETIEILPRATVERTRQLKTKVKHVDKFLFGSLTYTPDFYLWSKYNFENLGMVYQSYEKGFYFYILDVKGEGSKFKDHEKFSQKQKIIFHAKGLIINKVICSKWFLKTFCPLPIHLKDDFVWTNLKGNGRRKRADFKNCLTLKDSKVKYITYYSK